MSDKNSLDYQEGYFQGIKDVWLLLIGLSDCNAQTIQSKLNELKAMLNKAHES